MQPRSTLPTPATGPAEAALLFGIAPPARPLPASLPPGSEVLLRLAGAAPDPGGAGPCRFGYVLMPVFGTYGNLSLFLAPRPDPADDDPGFEAEDEAETEEAPLTSDEPAPQKQSSPEESAMQQRGGINPPFP